MQQHWIYIERDQGARDVIVGPYPNEADAAVALDGDGGLIEYLLSPAGGGGTDCSVVYIDPATFAGDVDIEAPECEWVVLGGPHDGKSVTDPSIFHESEHA